MRFSFPWTRDGKLRLLAPQRGLIPVGLTKTESQSLLSFSQEFLLRPFLREQESGVPDENRDQGIKWIQAFAETTFGFRVAPGSRPGLPGMTTVHSRHCRTLRVARLCRAFAYLLITRSKASIVSQNFPKRARATTIFSTSLVPS